MAYSTLFTRFEHFVKFFDKYFILLVWISTADFKLSTLCASMSVLHEIIIFSIYVMEAHDFSPMSLR